MKRIVSSLEEYNRISQDWQAKLDNYDKQIAEYDKQSDEYHKARRTVMDKAVEKFIHDLEQVAQPSYVKNVQAKLDNTIKSYRFTPEYVDCVQLRLEYGGHGSHDQYALEWDYDITVAVLEDGNCEITKSSGSWSGLSATTSENIEELENSVKMLKFIQSRPDEYWNELVSSYRDLDYRDYITVDRPRRPTDDELAYKQIEALAGTGKWIVGQGKGQYLEVTKATNSMFFYDEYMTLRDGSLYCSGYTRRMNKDKFITTMVKTPVVVTSKEEVENK